MSLLLYPDVRLRTKCKPVEVFTPEIQQSIDEMMDHMDEWGGIGLAAPQCGIALRMFVMHLPGHGRKAFVNPIVEDLRGGTISMEEGCLSLPGATLEIVRPASVIIRALDYRGSKIEVVCHGLASACVQHETDHLDGVLILDRAGPIDRRLALLKVWNAEHPGR
jgi:peptide deformylase